MGKETNRWRRATKWCSCWTSTFLTNPSTGKSNYGLDKSIQITFIDCEIVHSLSYQYLEVKHHRAKYFRCFYQQNNNDSFNFSTLELNWSYLNTETLATTDISSKPESSALNKGAIIGIAIGGAVAVFLIAFLASFLLRRRRWQTSRKSAHKPRPFSKDSTTESQTSRPQLYTKVSTSSDHDSSAVTCVHSSDVSSLSTAHAEMLYSYSYPNSTDGEMRPYSVAEVDATLSTFSQAPSGVSDQTSFYTPSMRSFESGEGRSLRTEHDD